MRRWNWIAAALWFALVWASVPTLAAEKVVLVGPGQEPMPILAGADAKAKAAAGELAKYLSQMSGSTFKVEAAPAAGQPTPPRGVFVGVDPALAKGLEPGAFRVRVHEGRVEIGGGGERGLLYGVYDLLERLGCRWWTHDEEDVPKLGTITLPTGEWIVRPRFSIHEVWNREAQSARGNFASKIRTVSEETISGGHTLYPLLTPYAKAHPEIYPMDKEGKRKANDLHFCYLAPGINEALTAALVKEVEARKGDVKNVIYFAGMGDWYGGMCQCEACKKVYDEEVWTDPQGRKKPAYSATLLRMINAAAEALEAKYPGVRVGTFAYMSLEAPPAKTKPRKNVVIQVPRLRHCTVHPADTCERNASFARNLERWCELAPGRVYVWEYGANFPNFIYPFPCLHSIAQNLRYYGRLGIRGVHIQGNYVSMGGDLAAVKNYVWSKVFWDPKADEAALVKSFCAGYYGPAAAEMERYIATLEASVVSPEPVCVNEFSPSDYLKPQLRTELTAIRTRALAAAGGDATFARRVREGTVGMEALALWHAGPLEEKDGHLVRTDLGGVNTLPRAEAMLADVREASPTEFNAGRSARMAMLTLHGGPVATLSRGPLRAKVAPMLNGQIRQLTFAGKDLLYIEPNAKAKGWPMLGGSIARAGTHFLKFEGAPTATEVTMQGEGGLASWQVLTLHLATHKVSLAEDKTLRQAVSVKPLAKGAEKQSATITTVWAVGKKWQDMTLEWQGADERWKKVTAAELEKAPADLTGVRGVRILLPEQGCVASDEWGAAAETLKATLDPKAGTLAVVANVGPIEAPMEKETQLFERRIRVWPVEAEAN